MRIEPKHTIADFLARHVVVIVGFHDHYKVDGSYRGLETICGTCFLMIHRNVPFLLTAGHIIKALDDALVKPNTKLRVCLVDSLHYNAVHRNSLWLPYETLLRESVGNNKDIDYGYIIPNQLTLDGLDKNQIIPVVPANWTNPPDYFQRYFLIGSPAELITINQKEDKSSVTAAYGAVIEVKPTNNPPDDWVTPFPRFYGTIDLSSRPDKRTIKDIGGMSGCPLLGMNIVDGVAKYWFYAIQSGWDNRNTIVACLFKPFAVHLQESLDEALDQPAEPKT